MAFNPYLLSGETQEQGNARYQANLDADAAKNAALATMRAGMSGTSAAPAPSTAPSYSVDRSGQDAQDQALAAMRAGMSGTPAAQNMPAAYNPNLTAAGTTMDPSAVAARDAYQVGTSSPAPQDQNAALAAMRASMAGGATKAAAAPGLIGSSSSTGAQASPWNVTAPQTVAGQVRDIIAEDSPLMQQAVSRADQRTNARGLLNSSIGIGAGQAALYDAALPMATADAATYSKAAGYNADQTNQFATNALNRGTEMDLANLSANTSLSNAATTAATSKYNTDASAAAQADSEKNSGLRQATASATSLVTSTQALNAAVMSNPAYPDTASKQAAITANNRTAQVGLQIIGAANNDIDIASYMDQLFPPNP